MRIATFTRANRCGGRGGGSGSAGSTLQNRTALALHLAELVFLKVVAAAAVIAFDDHVFSLPSKHLFTFAKGLNNSQIWTLVLLFLYTALLPSMNQLCDFQKFCLRSW